MTADKYSEFLALLSRGVPRKDAASIARLPFSQIDDRLASGKMAVEAEDNEHPDAEFLSDVLYEEAAFRLRWFEEYVVPKVESTQDPNKALEVLARHSPSNFASPGTRKVQDPDSGGIGPAASMLRSMTVEDIEIPNEETSA